MNNTRALLALLGGLIFLALLVVIAVLLMPPLSPEPGQPEGPMCTLIGCADGLTVDLVGDIPETYTVEATWEGGAQTFQCSGDDSYPGEPGCLQGGGIRLDGATPDEITLTVTWEGGRATETFRPTYTISRPNGPDCPPECRQGTVAMTLP